MIARQPQSHSAKEEPAYDLPDPVPLLRGLTQGALEAVAGVREPEQLARWLSEETFRKLLVRVNLSARARSARNSPVSRPHFEILSIHHSVPTPGIVEAALVVAGPGRARAVAIRLDGTDGRWRASSLSVL